MRRIALINQKGGVGKTTSTVNLGAALARLGRRVVLIDLDPQANLTAHLGLEVPAGAPSTYTVLTGVHRLGEALLTRGDLRVLPSNIDLSGAELELAAALGREQILRDLLDEWERSEREAAGGADPAEYGGADPADYLLIDCPPSLGLLSVNGLVAAREALITLQTEFLALQGMSQLVDVVQLLRRRLNPDLEIGGILPCLYDSRLRLAREVLAEIRTYFPDRVLRRAVGSNVKLAEAPSFGKTIFEYAPESRGAADYLEVAREIVAQERGARTEPADVPDDESAASPAAADTGEVDGEPVVELTPAPPAEEPSLDAVRRAADLPALPTEPFGKPAAAAEGAPAQVDEATRE